MNNPVIALVWESWRLARRWYLWVLPVACAFDFLIMRQAAGMAVTAAEQLARRGITGTAALIPDFTVLLAPSAFMINFMLAMFATLLAVSLGNKAGFPLSFEFRLPVRTPLLVAVPMLTLAALCASLYVLPILVIRLAYGVPIPLAPAGALIATLVVILLACGWSTSSSGSRILAMLVGVVVASQLFALMDPVDLNAPRAIPPQMPQFNRNIIVLSPGEYAGLAVICVLLYTFASAAIRKQRYGEAPVMQLPGVAPARLYKPRARLSSLLAYVSEHSMPPCPTSSPWRAELWLELRRQVLPIMLLSIVVAATVPVFFLTGFAPTVRFKSADYIFPGAVFFVGIGMAVFNRRSSSAGYMSAFEGTRGMSTLALAAIQMLAVVMATFCGIALVLVSVHFASGLIDVPGNLALRIAEVLASMKEQSALSLFTAAIAQFVTFVAWVMLLACIHTWSVVWGRWVPYGAGVLTVYAAAQAIRVTSGSATLEDIKQHLWAFALSVFTLTLLALARTLYTKVLSLRAGAVALSVWVLFLACSFYGMSQQEVTFKMLAPEMQAYRGALLVCPLLFFTLLLWSYDRLRHR